MTKPGAVAALEPCPCGSGRPYGSCCGPLHDGEPAPTAEALMRSRYTANVVGNNDHLFRTWHPRTRPDDVSAPLGLTWTGLVVLRAVDGREQDESGEVEFVASYTTGKDTRSLRETSRFVRRGGRWVYLDGDVGRS